MTKWDVIDIIVLVVVDVFVGAIIWAVASTLVDAVKAVNALLIVHSVINAATTTLITWVTVYGNIAMIRSLPCRHYGRK
jgi:hypothetical protein